MKKVFYVVAAVVLLAVPLAFAQQTNDHQMGKGMMDKTSMVSSGDGGVIVMIGKTLYKYDKNLNLVKQIELPVETPKEKMMDRMSDNAGMMQKKGCSCGMGACGGGATKQTSQQMQTNNSASEHEAHH